MGVCLFVTVGPYQKHQDANAQGWTFFTRSSLNPTVSVGTTEAELTCCCWVARELVSCLNILRECFSWCYIRTPVAYGDNSAANLIAQGSASLRAVRHLCLQRLYCRWVCRENLLLVREKRTNLMTADLLTKVLTEQQLEALLVLLGICKRQ